MPFRKFKIPIITTSILIMLLSLSVLPGCARGDIDSSGHNQPSLPASDNGSLDEDRYVRSSEGNGVWVDIVLLDLPETGSDDTLQDNLVFEVSMTTHQGDLRAYDVGSNVLLLVDGENADVAPSWESTSEDSHHPAGVLDFEGIKRPRSAITLILLDLADIPERIFDWEL